MLDQCLGIYKKGWDQVLNKGADLDREQAQLTPRATGGKVEFMSTDAGRWEDVEVRAH